MNEGPFSLPLRKLNWGACPKCRAGRGLFVRTLRPTKGEEETHRSHVKKSSRVAGERTRGKERATTKAARKVERVTPQQGTRFTLSFGAGRSTLAEEKCTSPSSRDWDEARPIWTREGGFTRLYACKVRGTGYILGNQRLRSACRSESSPAKPIK